MALSPTLHRIVTVLADGQPHRRSELLSCINDAEAPGGRPFNTLHAHLTRLRKILRPNGEDVICELRGYVVSYRHVRLLASATNGKR